MLLRPSNPSKDILFVLRNYLPKYFPNVAGYVDDPRNTDCAWMETTAFLFHDPEGDQVAKFDLKAGDDAKDVRVRTPKVMMVSLTKE